MSGTEIKDQLLGTKIFLVSLHRVLGALCPELGVETNIFIFYYFTSRFRNVVFLHISKKSIPYMPFFGKRSVLCPTSLFFFGLTFQWSLFV